MPVNDVQPVVCRLDLAPARVTFTPADGPSVVHEKQRVIVTADRIYIFKDARPEPLLWYEARIETFDGRNTIGYQVTTAGGDTVHFTRGGGCLCGSQIKSFRPFPQGLVQGAYNLL